ncbi:MAG: SPOR domain-containing protein [Spirochaetes bacterium]|nr:SPOR domain-containing protein [Spirochaetota bacterium]
MEKLSKEIQLFIFLFSVTIQVFSTSQMDFYKKAMQFENQGKLTEAIRNYKVFLKNSRQTVIKEKVQLKIARLTTDINQKDKEYQLFFDQYSQSPYIYIAYFELAQVYLLTNQIITAKKYFKKLTAISTGTPYWQKSLIEIAKIEILLKNYGEAIKIFYQLLENIEDYEDVGEIYYHLGITMLNQKLMDDAEEYFLITAGSFSLSARAPTALLQLIILYMDTERYGEAKEGTKILGELYPDSIEYLDAKKRVKKIAPTVKNESIALINLNENQSLKEKIINKIAADLKESTHLNEVANTAKPGLNGYYLQLGYYSSPENAQLQIEQLREQKKIDDVFWAKTVSSYNKKTFYRIVAGPFSNRDQAMKRMIELKEKQIESIILELIKIYE